MPDSRKERWPLSAAQHGIWLGQALDPASPLYNAGECIEIRGAVDPAVFEASVRQAVAEAETLHMRFVTTEDGPTQLLEPSLDWPMHRIDVGAEADPWAFVQTWMQADLEKTVDLTRGPLFTEALFTAGPDRTYWYQRAHHIALDGFGFSLIARRVAELYTARTDGRSRVGPPSGSLLRVIEEDRVYRASPDCERDRDFWIRRFADRPAIVSFGARPTMVSRPALRRTTSLSPSTMERMQAVAHRTGASWPDVFVAATAAYGHGLTGATEIVLGLPVMGRLGSVAVRIPSMVMNIVPLRVPIPNGASLSELARHVAGEMRASRPHLRYRYEHLRRDLKLVGGERRLFGPVVNIMPFDYDLRFGGHRAIAHNISAGPVEDISINVYARSDGRGPRVDFDANPDCYSVDDLAAHEQRFLAFLDAALSAPTQPITAFTIPGVAAPVTVAAHSPGVVLDGGPLPTPARDVVERILEHAREQPTAIAVEHGSRQMTYGELVLAAQRLASRLVALGAKPGTLVALLLPRSVEAITAIVATLFSGAGYLPLDPQGPNARTEAILADAGPTLLVTISPHAEQARQATRARVVVLDEEVLSDALDAPILEGDEYPAYVIYTSGSTGRPNGVVISRASLAHFLTGAASRYGFRRDDRVLQFAPLHFDASVEEVFLSLCVGGTLVLRTDEMLQSVVHLLDACAEHAITVLDLPTALWHEVAYSLSTGASFPPSVRILIIGGEAALPERVARFRRAVGPAVRLLNTYGPTEATVVATCATLCGDESAAESEQEVPIGTPLPGVRAAVLGADGRLVARGAVGELYLMGGGLATGYLGQPELSAARFRTLETLPGQPRAYRTGDLVRQNEAGLLVFVGRVDEELKISGHRVDPGEIETVLLRFPGVREVAVVGSVLPGGLKRLAAHVVADEPPPSPSELRGHAQSALPPAAVPSAFLFTDRLPRTSTGKIDRAALRDVSISRSPASAVATTELEKIVMTVWEQILGVSDFTVEDDFFERGGQSLQTIQVATRLGITLGREIPVAMVFRHPTIAELARALEQAAGVKKVSAGLTDAMLADAVLPEDIVPPALAPATLRPSPRQVLLTGATGFVGVHLLHALLSGTIARVVCLVRAADEKQAADRLRVALENQRLPLAHFEDRVVAVPADLSLPRLGLRAETWDRLAGECDVIYHDAAIVSLVRDYRSMRAVNVLGTREVLRLAAAARPKPVHHVSTLAVAPSIARSPEVPEAFVPPHPELLDGYKQSKWIAERLAEQVSERGVPVAVYRLGRVVGAPDTGIVNEQDLVFRLLLAGIPAGALPDLDVAETWTPVDYVARAIVALSLARPQSGTVYNLAPAPDVRLKDVFRWVEEYGYAVETYPVPAFRARLGSGAGAAESATLAFFDLQADAGEQPQSFGLGRVCADNVIRDLSGSGIDCPAVDRSLVFRYLDHCVETGKLPHPSNGRAGRA
ncbi:myxochelin non-ribosomal peptide synthetase MxcG [Polyangium sp. y55x31]|uniref:myxochelin non-ribosomal peptide synthetase MxcG n=1 Tax=Polyangium sp. y55x31 TaxID=3042688 RepID=UPI002482B652|nr:myxochelin non-ribosomal peptide synthetase MxcG [Polyangium sp. y55x31]MDI1481022.1 myxochelin non-ribosomal peptide synthetase MxcG [Polyangium sp. y55x31]